MCVKVGVKHAGVVKSPELNLQRKANLRERVCSSTDGDIARGLNRKLKIPVVEGANSVSQCPGCDWLHVARAKPALKLIRVDVLRFALALHGFELDAHGVVINDLATDYVFG